MLSGTNQMFKFFREVMQRPQCRVEANLPPPLDVINTYATTNADDAVAWSRVLDEYKQEWKTYAINALTVHIRTPTDIKICVHSSSISVAPLLRYKSWQYEERPLTTSQQLGHLARVIAAESYIRLKQKMRAEMEQDGDHVLLDLVRHHKASDIAHMDETTHRQGDTFNKDDADDKIWVKPCRTDRPAFVVRKVPSREHRDRGDVRAKDTMASPDLLYSYTAMGLPGQHIMHNTTLCPGIHIRE